MSKYLIVNADDFGYAQGVNKGIIAAHERGVVLSTSLMVDVPLAIEAAALAKQHPRLGVGLHFTVTDQQGPLVDLFDVAVIEEELGRQYQRCCELLGQPPIHLDSHHHVHLRKELQPFFVAWTTEHYLPLRGVAPVHYNGGFYGHWYDEEWRAHPASELIGVENLEKILRGLPEGITELACHPAYVSPDLDSSYSSEREIELSTLLNPRIPQVIQGLRITLTNFAAVPALLKEHHAAA